MDQSLLDSVLKATKDYWFLITLIASVILTLAYMLIFRVNPWDQHRSVKLRRDRVRFHNGVGYSLLETGHFAEAQTEFEEALKLSAEDQTALNGKYLTNLFINLSSYTADPAVGFAIQHHISDTGALERDQHRHIIDKYLGDLYMRISNFGKANDHYRAALKRKPDYPDALCTMGWQHYQEDEGDVEQMERMFRRSIEVAPYNYRGYHGLGYTLYMKAIRETDKEKRESLIGDAAYQSGQAKDLVFSQLQTVMDFGEVARSVDPRLSLYYHDYGKKIMADPALRESGDNRLPLLARLLMGEGHVTVANRDGKLAWIAYQTALDYLALQRMDGDPKYGIEHRRLYEKARRLDADLIVHNIYSDHLAILDRLLPPKDAAKGE